jgi:hypothetical protein
MPRIHTPTEISDGSWITLATTGAATASNPSASASLGERLQRATTNDSRHHLEQQRLDLTSPLRDHRRDHHRRREYHQRQPQVRPGRKRRNREHGETEVARRPWRRRHRDDRYDERSGRDQRTHLVGLRGHPHSLGGHAPTVLRAGRDGIPPQSDRRPPPREEAGAEGSMAGDRSRGGFRHGPSRRSSERT